MLANSFTLMLVYLLLVQRLPKNTGGLLDGGARGKGPQAGHTQSLAWGTTSLLSSASNWACLWAWGSDPRGDIGSQHLYSPAGITDSFSTDEGSGGQMAVIGPGWVTPGHVSRHAGS